MKIRLYVLVSILISLICIPFINADDDSSDTNLTEEFAIEMLYKHFESHYTPKDLLHKAQKEAMYIAQEFKKSEQSGQKAIDEFNHPFTRWNQMDGFHPFSEVNDIDKWMVAAHPNPALHKICKVEGLLLKFKDHAGRLVAVDGFRKLRLQPKGAWLFQYTTFIKSKTKIATPLYLLNVLVEISGTPYHVHSHMPLRSYSLKEMDTTIEYLDSMVEFWSIIE